MLTAPSSYSSVIGEINPSIAHCVIVRILTVLSFNFIGVVGCEDGLEPKVMTVSRCAVSSLT